MHRFTHTHTHTDSWHLDMHIWPIGGYNKLHTRLILNNSHTQRERERERERERAYKDCLTHTSYMYA